MRTEGGPQVASRKPNWLIAFSATFGPLDPASTRPANLPHHPTRSKINVTSNIIEASIAVS